MGRLRRSLGGSLLLLVCCAGPNAYNPASPLTADFYLLQLLQSFARSGTSAVGQLTCALPAAPTPRRMYVTTVRPSGNLGGIAGADATCGTDANHPGGGTFKALLVNGTSRVACTTSNCSLGCEGTDWVLLPNTQYIRPDATVILTTNAAAIFVFGTLTNYISASAGAWTGLTTTWQTDMDHCSGWTTTVGNGRLGFWPTTPSADTISFATNLCNVNTRNLICVEQ